MISRFTALPALLMVGCLSITPSNNITPPTEISPQHQVSSISISGFPWSETRLTGSTVSAAVTYFGGYWGMGNAVAREYETVRTDWLREAVKDYLENKGASKKITLSGGGRIVVEGKTTGSNPHPSNIWVTAFWDVPMWLSTLAIFGAPTWGWYEGTASIKVYDAQGNLLRHYEGAGEVKLLCDWYSYRRGAAGQAQDSAVIRAYYDALNKFLSEVEASSPRTTP